MSYCTLEEAWGPDYNKKKKKKKEQKIVHRPIDTNVNNSNYQNVDYQNVDYQNVDYQNVDKQIEPTESYKESMEYKKVADNVNFENIEGFNEKEIEGFSDYEPKSEEILEVSNMDNYPKNYTEPSNYVSASSNPDNNLILNQNDYPFPYQNKESNKDSENLDNEDEAMTDSEDNLEIADTNTISNLTDKVDEINNKLNFVLDRLNLKNLEMNTNNDNVHDIILFVLFGIFSLFVIDIIFRAGIRFSKDM